MSLSNHVSITISQDSVGVARAGFGVPLILSHSATWAERVRSYSSLAEVATDFAVTTSPEYLAASALFSQNPKPSIVKIGRASLAPTQVYTLSATVRNSHTYSITVKGEGVTTSTVTYASDSAATAAEIHKGLVDAINGVATNNYIAAYAALVVADDTFTAAADDICTAVAHGLSTGDGPFQLTTTTTLPAGLSLATDYWIIRLDADTYNLATSLANALAGTAVNITDAGTGTHTISDTVSTVRPSDAFTVTGDAAAEWFSLEVAPADVACAQTHADPGVATDLAAIAVEDNTWYGLTTHYNSNAYVLAAAAWVEANKKIYIADISETETATLAAGGSDTAQDLETLAYARTSCLYHPSPASMSGAAWLGRCLPLEPGSETWAYKTLAGVATTSLTSTHKTNIENKSANYYYTVAGVNITWRGMTADGDFIDITRGLDWLENDMQSGVYGVLAGANKVPFTDAGIALIEAEMRASLRRAANRGIITNDYTVTVPLVSAVSVSDRALRLLPDMKFSATLQGAVHKVTITGVVSV